MSERPGFILYKKQRTLFEHLSVRERGELITAVFDYFCDGDCQKPKSRTASMAFDVICEQLDYDKSAYEEKCKRLSQNANKRWNKEVSNPKDAIASNTVPNENTNQIKNQNTNTNAVSEADGGYVQPEPSSGADISPTSPGRRRNGEIREVYGAFGNVYLTASEYAALSSEFPDDIDLRIDRLSEYMETSGYRYANHASVIRRWSRTDYADRYRKEDASSSSDALFDEDEYWAAAMERSRRFIEERSKTLITDNDNKNESETDINEKQSPTLLERRALTDDI